MKIVSGFSMVLGLTAFVAISAAGCSDSETDNTPSVAEQEAALCKGVTAPCVGIVPQADVFKKIQTPLLDEPTGVTIVLGAGTFALSNEISIVGGSNVTVRGQGKDKSILKFSNQASGSGSIGFLADSVKGITFRDFAIEDPKGDGLTCRSCEDAVISGVRVEWTRGAHKENGLYAIYPVKTKNLLLENSVTRGASDSGLYVGESTNVVVRGNISYENVSGLQIENTFDAEVYDNEVYDNTVGLFMFDLPGKDEKKNAGRHLVRNNHSHDNNRTNFGAEGQFAGAIPPGVGMLIVAAKDVEARDNLIENNWTSSIGIANFDLSQQTYSDDPIYSPYPAGVWVHSNTIVAGGNDMLGVQAAKDPDHGPKLGSPSYDTALLLNNFFSDSKVPDIFYDGSFTDPVRGTPNADLNPMFICIENNSYKETSTATEIPATWVNLHAEKIETDEDGKVDMSTIDPENIEMNPEYLKCTGKTQKAVVLPNLGQ